MSDIFDSSVRSAGDLAGVFECDDDTGYFYFFDQTRGEGNMARAATQVVKGQPDFEQTDIAVEWDPSETVVGLMIRGKLWAAFDENGRSYSGGLYHADRDPNIPSDIKNAFAKAQE
jgi:hypothetical protein